MSQNNPIEILPVTAVLHMPEFTPFPKMARLSRDIVITEKLDGTNAQIFITEDGASIYAGSRNRWLTPQNDNYGFAGWVQRNREDLLHLGPGRHFGEWWGNGIGRNYGLKEKRFSLFNVHRWCLHDVQPKIISCLTGGPALKYQSVLPFCCGLVPVLYEGVFHTDAVNATLDVLRRLGSVAAPGFMNPEGIIVFHTAAQVGFKKTIEKDDQPKGLVQP